MTIVCGTDFSPNASDAADAAAALAVRLRAPVHVAHVVEAFWAELPEAIQQPLLEEVGRRLRAETARLKSRGADMREQILYGMADEALVAHAKACSARLIVVSSTGRRAPARWLVGSVADRTARSASVPVLVVRNAAPLVQWTEEGRRLRVMVASDVSTTTDAALAWLRVLRAIGPCDIVAVHSAWPPAERGAREGVRGNAREAGAPEGEEALRKTLEHTVKSLPGEGEGRVRIEGSLGRASSHVVAMALEDGVDLLVVGTHQRQGVDQLWHGSVSRGVLHEAPMSVVCVPA